MSTRPVFSPSWHRVAELRPRLRSHAQIHRQQFRGQTWYVLEDRVGERFHRFSWQAYQLIGLMNGEHTVAQVWELACERLGDAAPTQGEVIALLSQLHAADILVTERAPDTAELFERGQRRRRRRALGQLLNVFSWRIPLLDPERLLQRTAPLVRPFVGWAGALLGLAVVVPALVLFAAHWPELRHAALDHAFSAQSVAAFWLLFVLLKALHEVGHAVTTKAYGGEVHDMGVLVMVLQPVPYVDASAAWAFPDKWRRIVVGGAGMMVELFLAAVALFVWLSVEPGVVRTLALDTIIIAGVSTVLFNANPLLRFDGYYMLADWLESPNLRQRATRYVGYLCERYLFGAKVERPVTARGEPAWFVAYAVISFLYRVLVVFEILLFLGRVHFALAVLLASVAAVGWIGVPLAKGLAYLFASPRLRRVRGRAVAVTAVTMAALVLLVGFTPVPHRSRAEGVIWMPNEALVRASMDGFVDAVLARPGERVTSGQPLLRLRDEVLATRIVELVARRRELLAQHDRHAPTDRVKAQMAGDELRYIERSVADARQRVADLTVTALTAGTFVVPRPEDLPERFVKKGELVGYVLELDTVTVRGVVPQADIDLVRSRTRAVHVRLAEQLSESVPAVIRRVVPGASDTLPTTALGTDGGGTLVVDPRDTRGVTAVEHVFQVDVELAQRARHITVGGRAFLRFDHGYAPLAQQWYLKLRQLFLSHFDV